jgi:hypothetical protein
MKRILAAVIIALVGLTDVSAAQSDPSEDRRSHFGVIGSFSPQSNFRNTFELLFDGSTFDVRSTDFEIGFIVRGRQLGGEWGVSFVQKNYRDGSVIDATAEDCSLGCVTFGNRDIMRDVRLRGVSIHKFAPFVTIKRRVQIGLTVGGGVAQAAGSSEHHDFSPRFIPPNTNVQSETISHINAKELFLEGIRTIPIWKVELAVAALVAPGLKVRVGGGINFTNYPAFSFGATYLIGSK